MKHILFFSLPLLLFLISCSENETGPITYTDAELKEKLVGSWANDYSTSTFEANGTFTDNVDIDYNYGDSSYNDKYEIKGTYDIYDGILIKNINEWNYISNTPFGGGYFSPSTKMVIRRNLLYLVPVEICNRTDDNADSLWGEWGTFYWTHKYPEPDVFGKMEQTFNFNQDSMTVTVGFKSPFDSSGVFYYQTESLYYNPPEISWDNTNITRSIEFRNGQLYMFYKLDQLNPFVKRK
jgi:hypothetical protein